LHSRCVVVATSIKVHIGGSPKPDELAAAFGQDVSSYEYIGAIRQQ